MNFSKMVFKKTNELSPLDFDSLVHFLNLIRKENYPEDEALSREFYEGQFLGTQALLDYSFCLVESETKELIATLIMGFRKDKENKHLAIFILNVHPDFRCKGMGTELFKLMEQEAIKNSRSLLMVEVVGRESAANEFLKKMGASLGQETQENRLILNEYEEKSPLIRKKISHKAPEKLYEWHLFEGAYPEDLIEEFCEAKNGMHEAPRDNLDVNHKEIKAKDLRTHDKTNHEKKLFRVTLFVREKLSKKIVGYTQVFIFEKEPDLIWQGDTLVMPHHRGHAIGYWMKDLMIEHLFKLKEGKYPKLSFIKTSNAYSNESMRRINAEMGFKEAKPLLYWQKKLI